jgi:hypothetical protein
MRYTFSKDDKIEEIEYGLSWLGVRGSAMDENWPLIITFVSRNMFIKI